MYQFLFLVTILYTCFKHVNRLLDVRAAYSEQKKEYETMNDVGNEQSLTTRTALLSSAFKASYSYYAHLYISHISQPETLLAPPDCEKLLEIRIDVVQRFPSSLRNENSILVNEISEWPGMLILTDLRVIFLPYRCRSEKLLRLRFARLDIDGGGTISPLDIITSRTIPRNGIHGIEDAICAHGKVAAICTDCSLCKLNFDFDDDDLVSAAVAEAFKIVDKDNDGAIGLEEFLDFMETNNSDYTAVRAATVQISVCALNIVEHTAIPDSMDSKAGSMTSEKNLELINVSIPAYEDITQSFDKFDLKKFYKFDYKFEDYKFEYRVYMIHIEFGGEVRWHVHRRYSAFEALHTSLLARLPYLQLPDLPPKTPPMSEWPVFSSKGYTNFLQTRQEELERFLRHLIRLQEVWDQGCLLQRFLDNSEEFENFERSNEFLDKRTFKPVSATTSLLKDELSDSSSYKIDEEEKSASTTSAKFLDVRNLLRAGGRKKNRNSKAEIDIHRILSMRSNDGREFTFEIAHSLDASLVESRYGCDGSRNNAAWCDRFKEEVTRLRQEDRFAQVLASSPTLRDVSKKNVRGEFSLLAEYCRIGVPDDATWTISDINANYDVIPSYPRILILPSSFLEMDPDVLLAVVSQRSRGRIPVLTWLHPKTKAPLCRSSQPLSGLGTVLEEDDILLKSIHAATTLSGSSKVLRIVDARPKLNARANAYMGKGYEDVSRLGQDAQIHFLGIENVHRMRQSLDTLSEAIAHAGDGSSGTPSYDSLVVSSNWLYHGRQILQGALFIANCLEAGDPVLVHCSDGWDRTSQLCAISQLLLEPYYRTIKGFRDLIEKDFCSFGYLFESRCYISDERSPIFLQFLDVVWHVMKQFPAAFEFTEVYLIHIADGAYSRCFSTFLGNSERERVELNAASRSPTPNKLNINMPLVVTTPDGSVDIPAFSSLLSMSDADGSMTHPDSSADDLSSSSAVEDSKEVLNKREAPQRFEGAIVSIWEYLDLLFEQGTPTLLHNPLYRAPEIYCKENKGSVSASIGRFPKGLKPSVDPRIWPLWETYFLRGSSSHALQSFKNMSRDFKQSDNSFGYGRSEHMLTDELHALRQRKK